jgi:SAM-dependent methyltransferase
MRCAAPAAHVWSPGMSTDTIATAKLERSDLWAHAFARMYDPVLWLGERVGMRGWRGELLRHARGVTVELGSGTGLNLPHYPDVDELILTEPEPAMRVRLERKLRRIGGSARVLGAPAERLPFADGSVDTVVSTLVLCTVESPDRALREVGRVLRPDGQLLFLEHVRSDSPTLAAWQDRLAGPWRRFAEGCRCNRPTIDVIKACELRIDQVRNLSWRGMPPIVRPLVAGRARPTPLKGR